MFLGRLITVNIENFLMAVEEFVVDNIVKKFE